MTEAVVDTVSVVSAKDSLLAFSGTLVVGVIAVGKISVGVMDMVDMSPPVVTIVPVVLVDVQVMVMVVDDDAVVLLEGSSAIGWIIPP